MMGRTADMVPLAKISIRFAHEQLGCLQALLMVWYIVRNVGSTGQTAFPGFLQCPQSVLWSSFFFSLYSIKHTVWLRKPINKGKHFYQKMFPLCIWAILPTKSQIISNEAEMKTQAEIQQSVCLERKLKHAAWNWFRICRIHLKVITHPYSQIIGIQLQKVLNEIQVLQSQL